MNKKQLIWIISLCLAIGIFIGSIGVAIGMGIIMQDYPIVNCIYNMDDSLDIRTNKLPFTKESQREVVQWRCAKEFVDFNITDYDELFEYI